MAAVKEGSPAYNEGLRKGDQILMVSYHGIDQVMFIFSILAAHSNANFIVMQKWPSVNFNCHGCQMSFSGSNLHFLIKVSSHINFMFKRMA